LAWPKTGVASAVAGSFSHWGTGRFCLGRLALGDKAMSPSVQVQLVFSHRRSVRFLGGGHRPGLASSRTWSAGRQNEAERTDAAGNGAEATAALGEMTDQHDGRVHFGGKVGERAKGLDDHLVVEAANAGTEECHEGIDNDQAGGGLAQSFAKEIAILG